MKGTSNNMNEAVELTKTTKGRIFGKDITNQVKINDQVSNQNSRLKEIVTHNPFGNNLPKFNRVKHQSMDEVLLKQIVINHKMANSNINNIKENINCLANNVLVSNNKPVKLDVVYKNEFLPGNNNKVKNINNVNSNPFLPGNNNG
jgi:hypothetical protein